ncbi:hypothetical protein LINPERPRIM_LOCUS13019 [Linum perenne]
MFRECPLDLKEAISSVCFAAPRCADLPELMQVQMLFTSKYGKEFVAAATELMPDCGVNRQVLIKFILSCFLTMVTNLSMYVSLVDMTFSSFHFLGGI